MITTKFNDRYYFVNDSSDNKEYLKYISNKVDNYSEDNIDNDLKASLKIASVTGKYIVDTISGICDNCGIQYSVSENSLIWICPVCESFNIVDNKYKISVKDVTRSKITITIIR